MGKLDGKVALVTGGAEGIGATVGRMMVAEGAKVMLADVQVDKARALAEELGGNVEAIELDVRNLDQWHAAVHKVHAHFGKLNVLCNIAGISEPGNVVDVDMDSWRRTMDINLEGPFFGMRASIPAMEASGEPCSIVNIGSMIAIRAAAFVAAYSASKAGLLGLTRSVALDCAERGLPIRANMVHPGAIRTPMYDRYKFSGADTPENIETNFAATHPMNRIGEPEEVAKAFDHLHSSGKVFTTGCDFTVDGGGSIRS